MSFEKISKSVITFLLVTVLQLSINDIVESSQYKLFYNALNDLTLTTESLEVKMESIHKWVRCFVRYCDVCHPNDFHSRYP